MTLTALIEKVHNTPELIEFDEVMAVIAEHYHYTPSTFYNGDLCNRAGSNEGSCKLFAFAQLQGFGEMQTLALFGRYYRDDVLQNPSGDDHANIRNFILDGWLAIRFESEPLVKKCDTITR